MDGNTKKSSVKPKKSVRMRKNVKRLPYGDGKRKCERQGEQCRGGQKNILVSGCKDSTGTI